VVWREWSRRDRVGEPSGLSVEASKKASVEKGRRSAGKGRSRDVEVVVEVEVGGELDKGECVPLEPAPKSSPPSSAVRSRWAPGGPGGRRSRRCWWSLAAGARWLRKTRPESRASGAVWRGPARSARSVQALLEDGAVDGGRRQRQRVGTSAY
jgi:hypothetical protein